MAIDSETYLTIAANRRSIHALTGESTISDERLQELVKQVLLSTPSAFNTQSTRIIILLKDQHKKLWDIVKAAILPHVAGNPERAAATEARLNGFHESYATILFYEDPSTFDHLLSLTTYADKFEAWREQTSGMHQLALWVALEADGMGANVQHYNPLIDKEVLTAFPSINPNWKLITQMVIGKPAGKPLADRVQKPLEERFQVLQ